MLTMGMEKSGDAVAPGSPGRAVQNRRAFLRVLPSVAPFFLGIAPAAAEESNTVLVLGATGLIGQYVTKELRARGYRVRGLTRRVEEAKASLGSDGVEWVQGDLMEPSSLAGVMSGVDKVNI